MKAENLKGFSAFFMNLAQSIASMKKASLLLFSFLISPVFSQKNPVAEITQIITAPEVEAHLTFLASDELRGRETGSPEIDIAAQYIAAQFKVYGVKKAPGADSYFQHVPLEYVYPATAGELVLGGDTFKFKDDFLQLGGGNGNWKENMVYAGYGSDDELRKANVRGKLVVVLAGTKESAGNPLSIYNAAEQKVSDAKEAGAVGLIEIFASPQVPWAALVNYFASNASLRIKSSADMPHIWLKDSEATGLIKIKASESSGSLRIEGVRQMAVPSKNVIGFIEGTDPKLKEEVMAISAHYDHLGVSKRVQPGKDSIYNGARDNAIGVVSLLSSAKYLAQFPPKRSVLLIAFTAEEKGLLGSQYYCDQPVIPLKNTVFNYNFDGAGYNDVTIATIIGMERTTAEADMARACEAFGMKAALDPVPEQNLYERSDNYNFAVKGVPAINYAPGTKSLDQEMLTYYHQPADEVSTLDFTYLIKYFRSCVYAAVLLTNNPKTHFWKPGDKFEAEAKKLYGR